jgi:DNA-binding NarL/FixJ family response regulator
VSAVRGPGAADAPLAIVESCELLAWQTSTSRHTEVIAVVHGEQDPILGSAADLTEVVGIVDRDDMDEVLATAVHQVLDGHGWISPGLARRVLSGFGEVRPSPVPPPGGLTAREADVAVLVARGLSNAEIADELQVEVSTVKFHVSNALRKLGCKDRGKLAAMVNANPVPAA